jgi:hypothetical protein
VTAVDVESAKNEFVERATLAASDGLALKEQSEATLDKLNEVHFELVVSTNNLLSAVDPALNGQLNDAAAEIARVEKDTDESCRSEPVAASADAPPVLDAVMASAAAVVAPTDE